MNSIRPLVILLMLSSAASAQKTDGILLKKILRASTAPVLQEVVEHPDQYRLQIIYTQIDRDAHNTPSFKNYYFHVNAGSYFYPASMVKMPLAFLSLEKLHSLPVNKYTFMRYDSNQTWQHGLIRDSSSASGHPSIAHFIKRAFLISENDPYNRMYQFLGQRFINERLHGMGYTDVRIVRQFLGLTTEQNRYTNGVDFIDSSGKILYHQPPDYNQDPIDFSLPVKVGRAYCNDEDSLVNEPFDFTRQNNVSLSDFQRMLQSVLFSRSVPEKQRFNLTRDDVYFLKQYLSQYPSETPYPKYDTTQFYDSYVKFFFQDSTHKIPPYIRVFNKVGWSYGFLTDVSYIADFKNKIEFMLSATLYVNKDEIVNDNTYEYESVGHPFLYQLGQAIYRYDLKRKRHHEPDLSDLMIRYEKRDPADSRSFLLKVNN